MNIIEKLNRKTPDELKLVGDVWKVYKLAGLPQPHISNNYFFEQGNTLKKILDSKNELLEALISIEKYSCRKGCGPEVYQKEICGDCSHAVNKRIIEKETGLSWDKVKELLA